MTREVENSEEIREKFRKYAQTRESALRDELVEEHIELVKVLARHFANRGEPYEDLLQAGSVALIEAVDRFDPELGFAFSAYATKTIIGVLKRHFRDKSWIVRAPRRVQEIYVSLGDAIEELSQSLGRSPTVGEIAQAMDVTEDDVLEAMEARHAYRTASLDAPDPDGRSLLNQLGTEDGAFARAEEWTVLSEHLSRLPERERNILVMRFGEDLTQAEISERTGISQMQVSRVLVRTIVLLRELCNPAPSS